MIIRDNGALDQQDMALWMFAIQNTIDLGQLGLYSGYPVHTIADHCASSTQQSIRDVTSAADMPMLCSSDKYAYETRASLKGLSISPPGAFHPCWCYCDIANRPLIHRTSSSIHLSRSLLVPIKAIGAGIYVSISTRIWALLRE